MSIEVIQDGIEKLYEKLEGWIENIIQMLPNFILALLAIFFFWILSHWVRKLAKKALSQSQLNQNLVNLLSNITRILVICLGVVVALSILSLTKTVFSLLAGVGVIGLALGFAFQDLASNFISGVMLAIRSPLKIGDVVEIGSTLGTVIEVRLRDTLIRNFDGQEIFVPNKEFTSNSFTNYSSFGKRKIRIEVGIGYEDDPNQGVEIVKKALNQVNGILKDPAPTAFTKELGGSSVNLFGDIWFEFPGGNFFQIQNDAIIQVKKGLEEAGFNIPFPIRTIDLAQSTKEALSQLRS